MLYLLIYSLLSLCVQFPTKFWWFDDKPLEDPINTLGPSVIILSSFHHFCFFLHCPCHRFLFWWQNDDKLMTAQPLINTGLCSICHQIIKNLGHKNHFLRQSISICIIDIDYPPFYMVAFCTFWSWVGSTSWWTRNSKMDEWCMVKTGPIARNRVKWHQKSTTKILKLKNLKCCTYVVPK